MYTYALIALPVLLIALFQIVSIIYDPPAEKQSLSDLERELKDLNAEWAQAVERAREESELELQPDPVTAKAHRLVK